MKKIGLLVLIAGALALTSCTTIDKGKVGGKEAVVVSKWGIGPIFGAAGKPLNECIAELKNEGVTDVTTAAGFTSGSIFRPSSMTAEACHAAGMK